MTEIAALHVEPEHLRAALDTKAVTSSTTIDFSCVTAKAGFASFTSMCALASAFRVLEVGVEPSGESLQISP